MAKNKLGVMQGRLSKPTGGKIQSFPWQTWQDEFGKANDCGLDLIEWIFEAADWEKNPLMTDAGLSEIDHLSRQHHVRVQSVCADYFMDRPLLRASTQEKADRLVVLQRLLGQCAKAKIQYVVIPYVDASAIQTASELEETAHDMKACNSKAQENGITLCLETSLGPTEFRNLLQKTENAVKVNYDIGNSASLGYKVEDEFSSYGPSVATIHIKDRQRGGTTVPLGTGSADFQAVVSQCAKLNYEGPLILQAARQDDEIQTIRHYVEFVRTIWN